MKDKIIIQLELSIEQIRELKYARHVAQDYLITHNYYSLQEVDPNDLIGEIVDRLSSVLDAPITDFIDKVKINTDTAKVETLIERTKQLIDVLEDDGK